MVDSSNRDTLKDILLVVGIIVLCIGIAIFGSFISANNTAATMESDIQAQQTQSENVLGQYAPKLKEALGVTKLQTSAVADVISRANESRYGKEGSEASVQWIQEQNPNLDQGSYRRILDMIEAGRNDFANAQKIKTDKIRQYRTTLNLFPGRMFYSILGYPTPGFFEKYDKIVISDHAADAFQTGRDNGVDIDK